MLATIIPLKRLPRHLGPFSYIVPDDLKVDISIGQLVTIPLRKSTVFGLVFSLSELTEENTAELKPILSIVQKQPFLSDTQLHILDTLSQWYGVSSSVIATMMMPPLQKRKIASAHMGPLIDTTKQKTQNTQYFFYKNKSERQEFLNNAVHGVTLILVPTVQDIEPTLSLIPEAMREHAIAWHGTVSQKEQFSRWMSVRTQEKTIIIGTRGSVFLPFQSLDTIIIDAEFHEQHKHFDQAPRYHVHDVAELLAEHYQSRLIFSGYSPSERMYYASHKKLVVSNLPEKLEPIAASPHIIDMKMERHGKNFAPLAYDVQNAVEQHPEQTCFFYLNRRGFATSVGCNECGHVIDCRTCGLPLNYHEQKNKLLCHTCQTEFPMVDRCPKCHAPVVALRGIGIEQLASYIRTLIPDDKREIIVIDSETDVHQETLLAPHIMVGTDAAFAYVNWEKTDAIIMVDIDQQLHIPEHAASEHAWHLIQKIQFERKPDSTFIIQTRNKDHVVIKALAQPDLFYRLDLNLHRALLYPPYSYLIRYFYGHPNQSFAKIHAEQIQKKLAEALTKSPKKLRLLPPSEMQPKYYRQQYWYAIMVKSDPNLWKENLLWLNTHIPPNWKIDPSPISLLSP